VSLSIQRDTSKGQVKTSVPFVKPLYKRVYRAKGQKGHKGQVIFERKEESMAEQPTIIALQAGNYIDAVAGFVSERGGVSFVELRDLLSPYIPVLGDVAMFLPGYENIILWAGMSTEFFQVIAEALRTHRIETKPTQVLVYLIDGEALNMPLAKSLRQYKEPHWLPVAFNKYTPVGRRRSNKP